VLAAASPTHPIPASVYHNRWAKSSHFNNGKSFYGIRLPLGFDFDGPLFFAHYSMMIENQRTALWWNLFVSAPEVKNGLKSLDFTY
jgi:hypothetical protein